MSGIAALSSASIAAGRFPALSGSRASQASALGSGGSVGGSNASGNTTTTIANPNGSVTTATVNAQGQIVSTSTTQPANQAVVASAFAKQADSDILQGQMPASLLNMTV